MNTFLPIREMQRPPVKQAMVMAAGLGTRLRPLTLDTPKPLLPIMNDGTCCLGRALDRLHQQQFDRIVVNAYYLPDQIESFVRQHYPQVRISRETVPLETGGGFVNALPFFDDRSPVLIVNGDTYADADSGVDFDADENFGTRFVTDTGANPNAGGDSGADANLGANADAGGDSGADTYCADGYESRLLAYSDAGTGAGGIFSNGYESHLLADFSPLREDILLSIGTKMNGIGFTGAGDYDLSGRYLSYRPNTISARYVFVGYRVVMPAFMRHCAEKRRPTKGICFSFKECFDMAEANGRLAGHRFDGVWCDLSTIETLRTLREYITGMHCGNALRGKLENALRDTTVHK